LSNTHHACFPRRCKYLQRSASALTLLACLSSGLAAHAQNASDGIPTLPVEEIAARSTSYTTIDLAPVANRDFRDGTEGDNAGGWTDQGANSVPDFPTGRQLFEGIPFEISSQAGKQIVALRGQNKSAYPTQVSIPLRGKGAALYVLHTAAWMQPTSAIYTIRYEDGTSERAEIRSGRDIFDWWNPADGARVRVVWRGKNPARDPIAIGMWAWRNPHPEKTLAALDVSTPGDGAFVMIGGVTVASEGPFLSKRPPKKYDQTGWFPATAPDVAKRRGTLLDVSRLLHKPAGKYGWLQRRGEDFVWPNGRKQKFWGVNIVASANFPTKEQAEVWAEQLAQMGVNITRHHHMDADWSRPNIFGNKDNTQSLDPEALDRFDYFVAQLQKRGIYQYFDLLVNRRALPGDNIPASEDVSAGYKVEGEFDPRLIEEQERFSRLFLNHRNPYTGKTYGQDPAVPMLEIINESSLLYRNGDVPGDFGISSAHYRDELNKQWHAWLVQRFPDRQVLEARWKPQADEDGKIGLRAEEDAVRGTVENIGTWEQNDDWKRFSRARARDNFRFYADTMASYFDRMTRVARSTGYKGLIAGSNHWTGLVADLYVNAQLDYMDRHDYWAHPSGGYGYGVGVSFDPRSMARNEGGGMSQSLVSRRVLGLPYIITEWQQSAPNDYRAEGALFMGAACAFQNWSAVQFSWSHSNQVGAVLESNFDVANQPTMQAAWPAISMLLYRGDVAPSRRVAPARVALGDVFDPATRVWNRVPSGMAYAMKSGIDFSNQAAQDLKPVLDSVRQGDAIRSDTGELTFNSKAGFLLVDTPLTQGFAGFSGPAPFTMRDVEVKLDNAYGVVVLSSSDDQALSRSRRILVSALGNAMNTGMEIEGDGNAVRATGTAPVLIEPIRGVVTLKNARANRLRVWALDSNGQRLSSVPVLGVLNARRREAGAAFEMKSDFKAMFYEIERL
jgi:hypothetical protein